MPRTRIGFAAVVGKVDALERAVIGVVQKHVGAAVGIAADEIAGRRGEQHEAMVAGSGEQVRRRAVAVDVADDRRAIDEFDTRDRGVNRHCERQRRRDRETDRQSLDMRSARANQEGMHRGLPVGTGMAPLPRAQTPFEQTDDHVRDGGGRSLEPAGEDRVICGGLRFRARSTEDVWRQCY
ncbi:MAG TPA: hypothetical protein VLF18_12670 [Tahibacter sp.]|uniref:hypothetical protein n=1 Tax=Tahibacter sp. TaxID=2056211 RepID=UPI002B5802A6|nr:hypothetical protein [Tahibacter sp.]HSX61049.1 hypothetical protein [Tahibacter sp.]